MLGTDLCALLRSRGQSVREVDREDADITDCAAGGLVRGADVVVNCAAFTAVDAAESAEAVAFAVNAVGAAYLARGARAFGARMVHISTDYVFAGDGLLPYAEGAPMAPRSAYGRTKAAGEWAVRAETPDHLVVRTAWLYGAHGACFPRTVVQAMRERGRLDVVDDQLGQPTWTVDLADLVIRLIERNVAPGTYHGTSSGSATWHEFASAAIASAGLDPREVHRTTSDAFARPAHRPAYSVLGHDRLVEAGIEPIGAWRDRWETAAAAVLAES